MADGAEFSGPHESLQQSTRGDGERQMMQIGTLAAGKTAHLLQLTKADLRQPKIV